MAGIEMLKFRTAARHDRRSRCQALKTIAVKRADAVETHIQRMTPRQDVTDFRMHEAMERSTAHHHAAADSRADREVHQIADILRRAPALFRHCCRIHVGIETDGTGEFSRQYPHYIGVAPSGLRRAADGPI